MAAWDRQPDEGDKAFQAFASYRDMGPRRSVRSVAQELDKSPTQIGRWSSKHGWANRVIAWDHEQDLVRQRKQRETVEEVSQRQASILRTHIEGLGSVATAAARRLEADEQGFETMDAAEAVGVLAKLARPLAMLLDAERELHGIQAPDPSHASTNGVPRMTRAEAESYLTGIGFDDGSNGKEWPWNGP